MDLLLVSVTKLVTELTQEVQALLVKGGQSSQEVQGLCCRFIHRPAQLCMAGGGMYHVCAARAYLLDSIFKVFYVVGSGRSGY